MRSLTIAALLLAAVALSGAAHAAGTYQVRNASRTPLTCLMPATRGGIVYRFGLGPGRTFRQTLATDVDRQLTCASTLARRSSFRMQAGQAYELTETSSGLLRIRIVDGR
jgi:hypothetical protein